MKKHLLALAALAAVSGVAAAQSVTMYGIIDTSITTSSKGSTLDADLAVTSSGKKTSLTSSVWLPSVYGFTGSEDLGGGLKATFQLEGDLDADTGANTGSKLFRRISTVGLSSNTYGTVKLGKQIDPLFLQSFINNVRQAHSASLAVQGQLSYGAKGSVGAASDLGVFVNNAISYTTPSFNGFNLQVFHAFGEKAGEQQAGAVTAYLVTGKVAGVALSAGYEEQKNATTGTKTFEKGLLGAVYTVGALQLNAGVNTFKSKENSNIDAMGYEVGAAYSITPALTAAVNYVKFDDDKNNIKPTTTSASLKYSLSKRTSLWTLVSQADPKARATDATTIPVSSFYNQFNMGAVKQTGYAVGLTHTF
jgi:predicted porin